MINILYEDEWLVACEKPSGLLVHPYWKETNERKCLLKDLKRQTKKWLYPVHRLDRPTSGIVIFGYASEPVRILQENWREESTRKFYLGLAKNVHTCERRFDFDLNNENKVPQKAITLARPLETFEDATFMEIEILTGRKHQIRRHFSRRCSQIIGDRMYGKKPTNDYYLENYGLERLFLHAHKLMFNHPMTGKPVEITCPLPADLEAPLNKLRGQS